VLGTAFVIHFTTLRTRWQCVMLHCLNQMTEIMLHLQHSTPDGSVLLHFTTFRTRRPCVLLHFTKVLHQMAMSNVTFTIFHAGYYIYNIPHQTSVCDVAFSKRLHQMAVCVMLHFTKGYTRWQCVMLHFT
jgi:hypothetical protein